jgi:hypothetical protein
MEFIGDAVSPKGGPYPRTFAYDSARATVRLGADGMTMAAFWERSDDGRTWQPWMEMSFTRQA